MAQRMESVAPPGGIMISASTARLVDGAAALGEPGCCSDQGAEEPVAAQRLLGMTDQHRGVGRAGRILSGGGGDVRRSRARRTVDRWSRRSGGRRRAAWYREKPSRARALGHGSARGVEAFITFCESHTSQIPFHAIARLWWEAFGVAGLDTRVARDGCATDR